MGLDISEPLLSLARERIGCQPHIRLELGDAATYRFPSAETDLLFSRFGVMFFGDPKAAFANMRAAMSAQGRLCFACWQKISANPWVDIPQSRVESLLPERPSSVQGIPGQFSFADTGRVTDILTSASFGSPIFTPFEFAILLGQTLEQAVERSCAFGVTGRLLAVTLPGRVWIVSARVTPL